MNFKIENFYYFLSIKYNKILKIVYINIKTNHKMVLYNKQYKMLKYNIIQKKILKKIY